MNVVENEGISDKSRDVEVKEYRKKMRNRQSAQRARDRQKARMRFLEREVAFLTMKNQALHTENLALKKLILNEESQDTIRRMSTFEHFQEFLSPSSTPQTPKENTTNIHMNTKKSSTNAMNGEPNLMPRENLSDSNAKIKYQKKCMEMDSHHGMFMHDDCTEIRATRKMESFPLLWKNTLLRNLWSYPGNLAPVDNCQPLPVVNVGENTITYVKMPVYSEKYVDHGRQRVKSSNANSFSFYTPLSGLMEATSSGTRLNLFSTTPLLFPHDTRLKTWSGEAETKLKVEGQFGSHRRYTTNSSENKNNSQILSSDYPTQLDMNKHSF